MTRYHAAWVLPIAQPPIRDGWVAIDAGRIIAVGNHDVAAGDEMIDLGDVAVLPGLVNAHTHLELSYLRDQVPEAPSFVSWIRALIAARREWPDPEAPDILDAIDRAIAELLASGTALVGDISNTLVTIPRLVQSPLAAVVFYELIRFAADDAYDLVAKAQADLAAKKRSDRVRTMLAAHAPYSVSSLLFRAIRESIDRDPATRCSVHLSESREEMQFIADGTGPWRQLLEELGAWDPRWKAPGVSPVQYLDDAGFLDSRVLTVHGVHVTQSDLSSLSARGATVVACPRSNAHTGAGTPPIERFYESGVRVAVGTDSLASTPDLNLFAELGAMRKIAPRVPASALLDSATRQGARALGFEAEYGTIEPRKRARLIAVATDGPVNDVEEYLVNGVSPDRISWIEDASASR